MLIIPRLNKENMKNYLYNISHFKFEHVLFKKNCFLHIYLILRKEYIQFLRIKISRFSQSLPLSIQYWTVIFICNLLPNSDSIRLVISVDDVYVHSGYNFCKRKVLSRMTGLAAVTLAGYWRASIICQLRPTVCESFAPIDRFRNILRAPR